MKESLGTTKYNKIQSLINECLKEGLEVEISIPKKRLLKEDVIPGSGRSSGNSLKELIYEIAKDKLPADPEDYEIHHIDGDSTNHTPKNILLIHKNDHKRYSDALQRLDFKEALKNLKGILINLNAWRATDEELWGIMRNTVLSLNIYNAPNGKRYQLFKDNAFPSGTMFEVNDKGKISGTEIGFDNDEDLNKFINDNNLKKKIITMKDF